MIRFVISLCLLILPNSIIHASFTGDPVEFSARFKRITGLIDDEVKEASLLKVCPNQNVQRWVEKRLQPIQQYLMEFGKSTDPMVGVLTTSFTNLSLSLRYFYEADKTASLHLSPMHHERYAHSFKKNLLQHIEFAGTSLKLYMNMIFYFDPSKYAKYFPMHMSENHVIAMRSAGENLHNFYLSKSCYDLALEHDTSEAQIATALYKNYKPFCLTWQNNVNSSWGLHQEAFKFINPSAFKTQASAISKTTKTLEELRINALTWKKTLTHEHFVVMVMSLLKGHKISEIEVGDTKFLIIEGDVKSPVPTLPQEMSNLSLSPHLETSLDLSEPFSQLTLSPSKQQVESIPTPSPSLLPVETIDLLEDAAPLFSMTQSTPVTEVPNEEFSALKEDGQTISLEADIIKDDSLESLPSVMDQLSPMFDFLSTLEESKPTLVIQSNKINGRKKHTPSRKGGVRNSSKTSTSSKAATSAPVTEPVTYSQGRAVLPLGQKMTPDAIVEFLKAMDNQSSLGKERRSKSVRTALSTLRGYKSMRLKKAYKLMLSIVPYVGLFQSDRGKGSHCLLTVYQDGLPPRK